MKKVFKLFSVMALAALPLVFTACGDDEEETVKDGIAVSFGSTAWDANDILGDPTVATNLMGLGAYKDFDDADAPYTQGFIAPAVAVNTFSGTNDDDHYFFYFENEENYYGDTQYPLWQPKKGMTTTITAIDLTALTLSGNVAGTMFNMADAVEAGSSDAESVATNDLNITITNANWEDATAKDKAFKTMGKIAKM